MATNEGQEVKGQGYDHGDNDLLMNESNSEDIMNDVKISEHLPDKVIFTSNSILSSGLMFTSAVIEN